MRQLLRVTAVVSATIMALTIAAPAFAQAQTASQFYLAYRKAFDAAKKIEDVLPFMSAETRKQIEATPPAQRPEMFDMIKTMGALTNVKVIKETPAGQNATLTVEGIGPDKQKQTGTIDIVKEGGAWKLGKESWKN